jgi:hypothetical protein
VNPQLRAITDAAVRRQEQQHPSLWYDRMRADFGMPPVGAPAEPEPPSFEPDMESPPVDLGSRQASPFDPQEVASVNVPDFDPEPDYQPVDTVTKYDALDAPPLSQEAYAGLDTVDPIDVGEMDMPSDDNGQFAEVGEISPEQLRQVVQPGRPGRKARPGPALPRDADEGRPTVAQAPAPKQAKPLDPALVRPVAMNAGPEDVAGPLPDEAAPRAAKNDKQAMDVIGRLWGRWGKVATQGGMSKQDFYERAMEAYRSGEDHLDGIGLVNDRLVDDLRVDKDAALKNEVQQRSVQNAHAQRMGMTMPVYQFYQGMLQSGSTPDDAMLAAAHAMNPYAGWGNLLALSRKQRSDQQQALALAQKQQPDGPMDKIDTALRQVVTAGANPATLANFRNVYSMTPDGQKNGKGADQYALDNAAPLYQGLHGKANLTPQQQQFVRQYISMFPTYDAWRNHNGLEDNPANQRIWTAVTGRPVKSRFQQGFDALGGAVAAGADAAARFFGGQQPAPDQQANAGARRPFD